MRNDDEVARGDRADTQDNKIMLQLYFMYMVNTVYG
jgi:hypothetical protein